MNITLRQAEKVLTVNHSFTQLGFSMLLTRLKKTYSQNPTPATLNACTEEINAFLGKFSSIMSTDFAYISKL